MHGGYEYASDKRQTCLFCVTNDITNIISFSSDFFFSLVMFKIEWKSTSSVCFLEQPKRKDTIKITIKNQCLFATIPLAV